MASVPEKSVTSNVSEGRPLQKKKNCASLAFFFGGIIRLLGENVFEIKIYNKVALAVCDEGHKICVCRKIFL